MVMGNIETAQIILKELGLPTAQYNEISALTFLALANLREGDPWTNANKVKLRIHDILIFAKEAYNREYAENTRETVRRQVIHQFEQARVVDRNPDDPSLPTNSPNTRYALTDGVIDLIKSYSATNWDGKLRAFKQNYTSLVEIYNKTKKKQLIPVRLPSGEELHLSPGEHNQLEAAIVEGFAPRFAPGSLLVYLGEAADKLYHFNEELMKRLGIPANEHDKLPDVVLYDESKNRIFLIEAVTSHGPVSPKRQHELELMLSDCKAIQIYVSAFPNFKEFKRHINDIAWETEVWISEVPDHLIHFNGDKFLS